MPQPLIADPPSADRLPREVVFSSTPRRLVFDILGTLLVVLFLNLAAYWYLGRYTTNFGYWLIRSKWDMLKELQSPVDWLVLGDSSGNQGIMPEIFAARMGETAINLCTVGDMTTLNDLWMLEYYVKKFGPPKNVLIVHVYDVWHRGFNPTLLANIPLSWGFWDDFSLVSSLDRPPQQELRIFLERYVPIYSQNKTLAGIIRTKILALRNPFSSEYHLDPNGFMPATEPRPERVEEGGRNSIEFVSQNRFYTSYPNQIAMEKIIELAERYRFNIYLLNGPVYEGLYQNAEFQEYLSGVQQQMDEFARQSEYVHHISTILTFPAGQMQSTDHLILSAAQVYTGKVVEEIIEIRQGH
jgi:hypothetical protein